jgi:hypothetical protein
MACRHACTRDGHSSRAPVARRLQQPTRTGGSGHRSSRFRTRVRRRRAVPIRSCSRWGLPCRRRCRRRGALLPHRFTLAAAYATPRGGLFSVALSLGSHPPDVIRHRLSTEPGLSSPAAFRLLPERPSGRLTGQGWGRSALFVKRRGRSRCYGPVTRWCAPGPAWRSGSATSPVSTRHRHRRPAADGNGAGTP